MAVTNPTKHVTVRRLGRFKEKLDGEFATRQDTYTKQEVDEMALATMFRLYVDPADMHLKGRNTGDGTFEVVNGHLIMHQTTE